MPRRNLIVILAAAAVSLVCYQAADRNPLGRSFSEIADLIERRFVGHVDRNELWTAAVRGMIDKLNDPFSEYIEPKEAAALQRELDQQFAGIGVEVALNPQTNNRLTVISPIVGSPAYKAGVLAGDVITKIDGEPTKGMSFTEAAQRLRGKPGTTVQLTVERAGQSEPIELPLIRREVVQVDSVLGDTRNEDDSWNFMLQHNPNIGYVRIVTFGERTVKELKGAMEQLRSQNVQGLILDLRDDPGGLLSAAVGACNMFLPEGKLIVTIRGRDDTIEEKYESKSGEKFLGFPIAVLVNGHSASASEITAACLQDQGRATIVGERSWGKGTVQNMIPLHSGRGMLKLTTADYWRPSGRNIERPLNGKDTGGQWGVMPNDGFVVKMSDDDWQSWAKWRQDRDVVRPHKGNAESAGAAETGAFQHDPPLRKAVECIESQIKSNSPRPAVSSVQPALDGQFLSAFPPPNRTSR